MIKGTFTIQNPSEDHVRALYGSSATKDFALPPAVATAIGLDITAAWRVVEFIVDHRGPHVLQVTVERFQWAGSGTP